MKSSRNHMLHLQSPFLVLSNISRCKEKLRVVTRISCALKQDTINSLVQLLPVEPDALFIKSKHCRLHHLSFFILKQLHMVKQQSRKPKGERWNPALVNSVFLHRPLWCRLITKFSQRIPWRWFWNMRTYSTNLFLQASLRRLWQEWNL